MRELTHSKHAVQSLAFSPDGRFLAAGRAKGTVLVWRRASRKPPRGVTGLYGVTRVHFAGPRLVRLDGFHGVPVADPVAAKVVGHINLPFTIGQVTFSPDGGRLAFVHRRWLRPDLYEEDIVCQSSDGAERWRVRAHMPGYPAFSADGRRLITASDARLRVHDANTGEAVADFPARWGGLLGRLVALSPDGRLVVGGCGQGVLPIRDTATGEPALTTVTAPGGLHTATFSPDGSTLMTAGRDGLVRLWDVATGRQAAAFDLGFGGQEVRALAFAPDGLTAAVGGSAGRLVLFDTG